MKPSTIIDLGERARDSPDLSIFDYYQLFPVSMLTIFQFSSGIFSLGQSPQVNSIGEDSKWAIFHFTIPVELNFWIKLKMLKATGWSIIV